MTSAGAVTAPDARNVLRGGSRPPAAAAFDARRWMWVEFPRLWPAARSAPDLRSGGGRGRLFSERLSVMASLIRPTRPFPLPPNPEFVTKDGKPHVRVREGG